MRPRAYVNTFNCWRGGTPPSLTVNAELVLSSYRSDLRRTSPTRVDISSAISKVLSLSSSPDSNICSRQDRSSSPLHHLHSSRTFCPFCLTMIKYLHINSACPSTYPIVRSPILGLLSLRVCVCVRARRKEADKKELDPSLIGSLLRKYLSNHNTR